MLWLSRPPWLRWLAVTGLVCLALWSELRPTPTVEHPFARVEIAPGDPLTPENVEQRRIPVGVLPPTEIEGGSARSGIGAGEPLTPSAIAMGTVAPSGWYLVPAEVPRGGSIGQSVRLIALDTGLTTEGVVTAMSSDDPFEARTGSVAVPGEMAAEMARASLNGSLVVLVGAS